MLTLPSQYHPTAACDFIGNAHRCALFLEKTLVPAIKATGAAKRILFTGPPGCGKTKLAGFLTQLMGAKGHSVTKLAGRQLKTEQVEAIAEEFKFGALFGNRILWIEELSTVPVDARSRLLTLCDDLPSGWLLVATDNKSKAELVEMHPATARRYDYYEIQGPSHEEMVAFCLKRWPMVPASIIATVCTFWKGCLGGALNELDTYVLQWNTPQPSVNGPGATLVPQPAMI